MKLPLVEGSGLAVCRFSFSPLKKANAERINRQVASKSRIGANGPQDAGGEFT